MKAKEMEIPEFPPCTGELSIYFGEIHYRAEAVTPVLKGIPGFLPGVDLMNFDPKTIKKANN